MDEFSAVEDKSIFLEPTIQFLNTQETDGVRSWGTNVLEMIGREKTFNYLMGLFKKTDNLKIKRGYKYTRFFALRHEFLQTQFF